MLPTPRDAQEKQAIADIAEYGLHVINVLGEDDLQNFSYSVGLWHSFKHPEVIIYGLKYQLAHWILNEIGSRIREGKEAFQIGHYYCGFLEGFQVTFLDVPIRHYKDHVTWSMWLHGGSDFPLLQCVWPTTDNIFPWDDDATDWFRNRQPVLKFTH